MKTHMFARSTSREQQLPNRLAMLIVLLLIAGSGMGSSDSIAAAQSSSSPNGAASPAPDASGAKTTSTGKPSTEPSINDVALREYLSGNGLLNRGLFDLAAAEYRKFLAAHPDHEKAPLAHYGLGVCLFRQGQFEAALAELTPLDAQNDFSFAAEVGTMRGQCLLSLKQFNEAAGVFDQVVSKTPAHALADDAAAGAIEALFQDNKTDTVIEKSKAFALQFGESPLRERVEYLWALAAITKLDSASAIEQLNYLIQNFPKSNYADHAIFLLAQCEQATGQPKNAIANYRRVLTKPDSAYAAESLLALGTILHSQKQFAAAGEALDRLLEKFASSLLAPQAKLERGLVFFDDEKFDRAAPLLDSLASTDGENADEAAYWGAKCRFRQNQFAEAAHLLSDASSRFGKSRLMPEMTYDRAVALIRAGSSDEAVTALTEFHTRFPQHELFPEATELLAVTLHQQKKYDESDKLCTEFLKQFDKHVLAPAVLFLSGENEFLSAKYADAVERFRDFLTRYTSDARAVTAGYRIAIALYRLERFDESEPLLIKLAPLAAKDPTYRNVLLALGDVYIRRSDWKNAEERLADYLNAGLDIPAADDALMKLAMAKERQDRDLDALTDYARLVERFPKSTYRISAIFQQGQILLSKDRLDEAAPLFEKMIAEGGDSPLVVPARQNLAAIAMRQQKFDRAAELYAQAAAAKSSTGTSTGTEGVVTTSNGSAEAESFLGQAEALMAGRKFAEAEKTFASFLSQAPNDPRASEARARMAIAIARQDRPADALAAMDAVGTLNSLNADLRAALSYEKAWCLRTLNRNDEAQAVYRTLADANDAGDLRFHAMLEFSEIEASNKKFDSATAMLHKLHDALASPDAIQKNPELAENAAYRLAVCEFELSHFEVAATQFGQFLKDFPKSSLVAAAYFYCGESLFRMNSYERAIEQFSRLTNEFTSDSLAASGLLRLGECDAALQRWSASEEAYKAFLLREGNSELWYQARFGVGWACENQKRYDDAMTSYRDVVARHQGPTAARAQFQIGECLFAQGKYQDAAAELLKVEILYAFPEWSAAGLYEAARCFEKLDKPVEARTHFHEVAEKYKETHWAQLAAKRVSELSSASAAPGQ